VRQTLFAVLILFLLAPRVALPQGEPLGPEFRVNTVTEFQQSSSSVAAAGGDFVVVWHSDADGDYNFGVHGQRYDGAGNPLGTEFLVNTYPPQ
jgi:hypothetical protein